MHFNRWRISHCGTRKSQQVWPFRHGCISHAWSWQTKSKRWPYPNWTLLYVMLRETRRKCIGNCTTGNVPCKQCRTTWSRGSCSCPLLHQFWERQNYGTTQGTTEEMLERPSRWKRQHFTIPERKITWWTGPQQSYHYLKEIDTTYYSCLYVIWYTVYFICFS